MFIININPLLVSALVLSTYLMKFNVLKLLDQFYEPEDVRWSSSENLFILINRYNF